MTNEAVKCLVGQRVGHPSASMDKTFSQVPELEGIRFRFQRLGSSTGKIKNVECHFQGVVEGGWGTLTPDAESDAVLTHPYVLPPNPVYQIEIPNH
jgi:hypothetical protein